MKKRFLALLLSVLMIVSLLPMTALAADDHAIKLVAVKDTTSISGKEVLRLDFMYKSGTDTPQDQMVYLKFDASKLAPIMVEDGSDVSDYCVDFTENLKDALTANNYSAKIGISTKNAEVILYTVIDSGYGYYCWKVTEPTGAPAFGEFTRISSIFFGLKGDLTFDTIPSDAIKFSNPIEDSAITSATQAVLITANDTSYEYIKKNGDPDTLGIAPVIVPGDGVTFLLPALTGTPTISGAAKNGEKLTAATTALPSDAGTLSYQWYRGDAKISGATSDTYTCADADAGKTIKVEVSAENYSGSVTSAPTAAVAKADGPAAPTITETSKTYNAITVTNNSAWEYSKDGGSTWQNSNTFVGLSANTTYSIVARVKETAARMASASSAPISITTAKAPAGTAVAPAVSSKTDTTVNVTSVTGQKYMIKPATEAAPAAGDSGWGDIVAFTGLTRNTAYMVYSYIPESGDKLASAIVSTAVTTDKTTITDVLVPVTDLTGKTYNSAAQEPTFGGTLTAGTDYTVSYAVKTTGTLSAGKPLGAGTYTVTVAGAGDYAGSFQKDFTITAKTILESDFTTLGVESKVYTGSELTQTITPNGVTEGTDYSVVYSNNTYAGTASYTITGTGNYTGTINKMFNITAANQNPTITHTANVTKGGNTLDLNTLVTNVNGAAVTFSINGATLGCTISSSGVLTSADTTGPVDIDIHIAAVDVNADGTNEYSSQDRSGTTAITVTIQNKATATLEGVTMTGCTYGETLADPTYTEPAGTTGTTVTYSGTRRNGAAYPESTSKPTDAGEYDVHVTCETDDTIYACTPVGFTVEPKNISGATVTLGTALTYNSSSQTQTVSTVMLDGEDITASCDVSGNTRTNAGAQNLTVTAQNTSNYIGSVQKEFTVAKKAITPTIDVTGTYTFTGEGIHPTYTVKDGGTELASTDYTATVTDAVNAGTATITVSEKDEGNYTFADTPKNFTIEKGAALLLPPVSVSQKYTVANGEKLLENIMPTNAGALSYAKSTQEKTGSVSITSWDVDSTGKVTFTLSGGAAGDTVTLTAIISSENIAGTTVRVVITLTEKDPQAALTLTGDTTVVYGETLTLGTTGGSGTGAVTYVVTPGTGDATITGNVLTATKAGTVTVKAVKAADDNYSEAESTSVEITIAKATPTGTPAYTAITAADKTLADAALDVGTITPAGAIAWDLGDAQTVAANTAYDWTFTPTDTTNYNNLTGSITPYVVYIDDTPATYAITVAEAEHGSVSADAKTAAAGKTVTLTVAPEKGFTLETLTVTNRFGKEVELTAVEIGETYTFKMPASAATVKATFMDDNTMLNFFVDVTAEDYFYDAVLWAAKNGITNGVDALHFDPYGDTTRAQMVTFLWRVAGSPVVDYEMDFTDVPEDAWYTEAVRWATSEGITNGTGNNEFSPYMVVDRAQVVTFLYRYSKAPAILNMTATGPAPSPFEDVSNTAYYYNAVLWAVSEEITNGTGEGIFSPEKTCTRGEVVTFLYRFFAE